MDTIIVKAREDMNRILEWVRDSRELFENGPEFKVPFRKGELLIPFDGCRLEFQCEGERCVRFKLYPILETFCGFDWTKDMAGKDLLLSEFLFDVDTLKIREKRFYTNGDSAPVAPALERDGKIFNGFATEWLALMLLAVYYRPQFESKKQVAASSASGKKGKKVKKAKRTKTLYTRTYVVDGDLMDKLPKPVKRHAKPNHEYGVRGHYRRYKSGKVAWVHPHIRCKWRKLSGGSVYVAKIEKSEK